MQEEIIHFKFWDVIKNTRKTGCNCFKIPCFLNDIPKEIEICDFVSVNTLNIPREDSVRQIRFFEMSISFYINDKSTSIELYEAIVRINHELEHIEMYEHLRHYLHYQRLLIKHEMNSRYGKFGVKQK